MLYEPTASLSPKAAAVRKGDVRTISRTITALENGEREAVALMKELYSLTGNARIIGFTGAPGAGKSSVIHELIHEYLRSGLRVAVVAVDPTSEFTGGGVLGDRIRMPIFDDNLFIRSLGARGRLGGLSNVCGQVLSLLDAAGFDRILVETVGAGQSEIEIRYYADAVVVVTNPNQGDDIQMLKAGILEIGDVFIVNKCELPGADSSATELVKMTHLYAQGAKDGADVEDYLPPVIKVSAREKIGLAELFDAIENRFHYLEAHDLLAGQRMKRVEQDLSDALTRRWKEQVLRPFRDKDFWKAICEQVSQAEIDPWTAGEQLWTMLKE
jgi:LAO/AO transport system kinase